MNESQQRFPFKKTRKLRISDRLTNNKKNVGLFFFFLLKLCSVCNLKIVLENIRVIYRGG